MSLHHNYEDDYNSIGNITSFPNKKQFRELTKRQRRQLRKEQQQTKNSSLKIRNVQPKTHNQDRAFQNFDDGYNLLLHGLAGTGKTFISLYLALSDIIEGYGDQKNITIVRSVVPTRDMGYLPGNQKEKSKVYEAPYANLCSELFGRGDAYEVLKGRGMIDFITTSFVRGVTLSDTTVIVDECQNLSFHELDSIITRLGENSRIIFCGDFRQSDLIRDEERKGVLTFMEILSRMKEFESVEFEEEDIVRSKLVKEYIISKVRSGIVQEKKMKRDLNELYGMVCTDRNEYLQAVQAVVTFSGLHGEELQKVLPKLQGPQPEPTLNDIRGYTPYEEREMKYDFDYDDIMSRYEGGQPLDDIIMGGSDAPDTLVNFPDFLDVNFDPIMPQANNVFT